MGFFSKSPAERLGPDLLDRLPLGISIYRLERPGDPEAFRIVYSNAASGELTGLDPDVETGRMLVDVVPDARETGVLDAYLDVLAAGEARDLGTIEYGDERIERRTYALRAIPLDAECLALLFEDVSERAEARALRATQAELRREEARYRSLVEATAAIVWTTPPSGELGDDQDRWRAFTGQSVAESVGRGWLDAVHPDDRDATAAAWREALATKQTYEVEHRLRQPDGSYRRMAARAAPVLDDDGAVVEWVGVHTDVEAQHQASAELAASEARFRTLFDAIGDVVLVYPLGPDGPEPFVTFNEAAVARYGYTADELRSMTVEDLVDGERFGVVDALDELRRTRRATFDSVHRTKHGDRLYVSTHARLVTYDDRLCVVSLCRDDASGRHFRREIARSNRRLEEAVAERTAQLEAFSEDLKILHGITTAEHASPQARFEAYLEAGRRMFDLPVGILSATPLDPETGERMYRLEAVLSPDSEMERGLTVPLSQAFCDAVVERGETVTYADATVDAPEHPACVDRGLRAFIGTPVLVDGETFGTLNFVSPEPRPAGFSDAERDLVEVMAQAIGRRIEADRAEAAQTVARERYRTIVETVEAGVVVVDADLRILLSNPSARELLGLADAAEDSDDLSARWPVLDAERAPVPPAALPEREVLRTGRPVRGVIQGVAPPGEPVRWYRVNATPLDHDADGRADAVVVSFDDVSEFREAAREAERSKDMLRAVLSATADGVMAFRSVRDAGGEIEDFEWLLATPRAAEIVGRDADDLVGARLLEVFPSQHEAGLFDAYAGVVETGGTFETIVPYVVDGGEASFRVRAVPLKSDDGFTVTFSAVGEAEAVPFDGAEDA